MQFDAEILLRFLIAALWGAIVGAERQYRGKSAGFRTLTMISLGACFFTMMSVWIADPVNRDRVASNIVTGIGFLGAGVIFRGENRINGITTAATIWVVAAVGMGIGAGYYFASACTSVLIFFILAVLPYVENSIDRLNQSKTYLLTCPFSEDISQDCENLLKECKLNHKLVRQIKEDAYLLITWETQGHSKNHDRFIAAMLHNASVTRFEYY